MPSARVAEPRPGFGDASHLIPHYPAASPLDAMIGLVVPGSDGYAGEKIAAELQSVLGRWSSTLRNSPADLSAMKESMASSFECNFVQAPVETNRRSSTGVEVSARAWAARPLANDESGLGGLGNYFSSLAKIWTAEFEILQIGQSAASSGRVASRVRYSFAGERKSGGVEERNGYWEMVWTNSPGQKWLVEKWSFTSETTSRAPRRMFEDVTASYMTSCESYGRQLRVGTDEWRTVLDGASGIDVYGNNGVAAGDFDNDGFDDLYVCQPSGLPNRLYRNRGDGRFEDVTESAGVAVLDATSCALFADFQNRGVQDLLVVCDSGPLLFLNNGKGKFEHRPDAFAFAKPPQGTFTHAAIADYDRDGKLDIYFCLYTYYLGLDQYHYPSPYFDARNGPPNFLFHNQGDGTFIDRTETSGLGAENDRYSFACAWGDINGNGWPDLYVANDFGRSNLYRNNGDGTFAAISEASGANDVGAGMSACWLDAANSGKQDIYVSNMWSAAGQRVSADELFHPSDSAEIKSLYRQHARGNSFYKNLGDGRFKNTAAETGVELGRWAWSSDSWDFDHDGFADLYVANGYISGSEPRELSSFFWRQVVGNSPSTSTPVTAYEQGWSAINELIRSDSTWSGYERNTLFANNGDGTFSDISGISGLDFLDDSRSFALADLNHDGRLEVVLKNRTGPQLRILQNTLDPIGDAIVIRLRGTKSNRDAVGAAVTIRCGPLQQTKYLQAGTGFLSQHSKEFFFGIGKDPSPISIAIRWPSGASQSFPSVPRNRRITFTEGDSAFGVEPFAKKQATAENPPPNSGFSSDRVATWLIEPLPLPEFALTDTAGKSQTLDSLRGKPAILHFWSSQDAAGLPHLKKLDGAQRTFLAKGIRVFAADVAPTEAAEPRSAAPLGEISITLLRATPEFAGAYNIIYRYLFDRRRDLPLPCAFLLDENANLVKVVSGEFEPEQLLADAVSIPRTREERISKALPFAGKRYRISFQRNDFTYGVALFQHGYFDAAASSFKQVIAAKPDNAEAHYNLGTLYLRKNQFAEARASLEKATALQPEYPEAWNNLGMIAGHENEPAKAVEYFRRSLSQRPNYVTAMLNLGNTLRRQGQNAEALRFLTDAATLEPENPEANYSLGMLYARQGDAARAESLIQKAISLRRDYPDALNNLGVLFIRDGRNSDAEQRFKSCIEVAPNFDQAYLNLAQLYAIEKESEKARATLESLLKLQPDHKLARQALEMLH
ncbi:MAG TPA: FG-GAP-like repeat-containing protein [Candidatus Acidoferrum sp.]|nr:FG-GAP-like repeat-containing protein [Candidatus Acidoferrum sp.]